MQHTFFVYFFAVVLHDYKIQRETSRNFLVTRFMEKMSNVFLFTLFSPPLIFTLVAASISHFLTAATKFSCCTSNKKSLLCFLSLALDLCRSFSRWASVACRLLPLFLCLSLSLAMWFPAKITSSCIWVAIPVDSVILHWSACESDGRAVGRTYGHMITRISQMGRLPPFLMYWVILRAWSSANRPF